MNAPNVTLQAARQWRLGPFTVARIDGTMNDQVTRTWLLMFLVPLANNMVSWQLQRVEVQREQIPVYKGDGAAIVDAILADDATRVEQLIADDDANQRSDRAARIAAFLVLAAIAAGVLFLSSCSAVHATPDRGMHAPRLAPAPAEFRGTCAGAQLLDRRDGLPPLLVCDSTRRLP